MRIGNIDFPHGVFLAPMAGVTDIPFRYMCKKYGAEGVYTEMLSSRALCFEDKKTAVLAEITETDRPCILQLFGNDPEIMAKAAVLAMRFKPDIIDINMGCPAPKISGNGDGCALMKNPSLVYDIVYAVKKAMNDFCIPVSVKMRSGYSPTQKNAVEVAVAAERAGADAICVHGRTREQMYAPPVDYEIIANVKAAVRVPVIGNGDITDFASAKKMIEATGCDGIMVGRGAMGNPYVFDEIICGFESRRYVPVSKAKLLEDIILHMEMLLAKKGELAGAREARKHLSWYVKGIPGAAMLRDRINKAESLDDIRRVIEKISG